MARQAVIRLSGDNSQLKRAINESTSEVKKLDDEVKKTKEDLSNFNDKTSSGAAEIYRYRTQTKNAKKEISDLGKNLNTTATSLGNFTNSLSSGNISGVASSLQGLSSAFGGLGGNIGNLSTSLGAIGGSITSLINPYALLGTAVVGAGAAFYDFNNTLDTTTRKVEEVLGVSRDIAMPIRNSIQAIADTYGVEFGDVLGGVNTLMSQFGISAEEALDIVSKGFASMGDSGESILPLIQQFAPQFRDAGIEASELMAIIANTRGGIFGEEGMAAIATAGKNIKNMSDQTKQSLEAIGIDADGLIERLTNGDTSVMGAIIEISNKLRDLPPQSQEVGSVLQNVFGRQGVEAGQELITNLSEVETNLDTMKEKTGDWGESMDDLKNANERLQNQLSSMFGTSEGGFDLIGTKIRTEVLTALSDFIDEVKDVYENSLLLQGAWMTVSTAVQVAWSLIKNVLQMFAGTLVGLEQMIEGLALAIEATFEMKDPIKGLQKFENGWNKLSRTIGDNISDIGGDWEKLYKKYGGEREDSDKPLKHQSEGNTRIGNTWYDANGNKIDDPEKKKKKKKKKQDVPQPPKGGGKKSGGTSKSEKIEKPYDDTAELKKLKEIAKEREKLNQILDKSIDKENQLADSVKRLNELLNSGKLSPRDQQKALDALTNYATKLNEVQAPLNKYRDNTTAMNDAIANATQTQKIFDSDSKETKASLTDVANVMGSVGSSLGTLGEAFKVPVLDAAGIVAGAIATMIQSYATASAQAATLGPWAWIAFGAEGLAQLVMMISQIKSMKFAEGGIVGGNRTIGDMNLARVNSGEMIINGRQQRNLFNIINSGALAGSDSNQTVHFRVSGNDLVGVLNNYNNKRSKAR